MKKELILLLMFLYGTTLTAQTLAKNDPLKFDADYYLMEKDFTKALNTYKNILRSEPDNADIKYKIGICYLNSEDEKSKAISFLEEACLKVSEKYNSNSFDESNAPIDALFLLGSAYRVDNQIDKAIESYKKYRAYLDPKDDYNLNVVDQYISSCEMAGIMQQKPVDVTMNNMGSIVNDELPNFNAVLSGDGKTMFFTSPARQGYDIFLTTFADTAWTLPKNVTTILGTGKYMRTSDLSFDGTILLLTLDDAMNSDIFICRQTKGKWSKAEPMGKEINSKFNETHASLSNDGRTLYFTSDRKGGQGDLDIYKAEPSEKGFFGNPVNLGAVINTPLNEETPFITEVGDKLYFSSEGHNGIGGYDIYYYDFSNPSAGVVNLGFPINSTDNDLFFVPTGDGHTAYFSMKGKDSRGGRDIYQVYIPEPVNPEPEMPLYTETMTDTVPEVDLAESFDTTAESITSYVEPPTADIPEPEKQPQDTAVPEDETVTESEPEPAEQNVDQILPDLTASISDNPANDIIPSAAPSKESASSYRVQIMALHKPIDLNHFNGLPGVRITRNGDKWYRYTLGNTNDIDEAQRLLADLRSKGYADAFISRQPVYPQFTIQVMAVPGPVVNLNRFDNLSAINVTRGSDSFCRYTTGEFPTKEEAMVNLERVKDLGYRTAFVTKMK